MIVDKLTAMQSTEQYCLANDGWVNSGGKLGPRTGSRWRELVNYQMVNLARTCNISTSTSRKSPAARACFGLELVIGEPPLLSKALLLSGGGLGQQGAGQHQRGTGSALLRVIARGGWQLRQNCGQLR
jgi:hypothetical protein